MCDSTLHLLTTTVGQLADVCQLSLLRSYPCLVHFSNAKPEFGLTVILHTVCVSGAVAKAAVLFDTYTVQQRNHSPVQKSDSARDQEERKPGSQL